MTDKTSITARRRQIRIPTAALFRLSPGFIAGESDKTPCRTSHTRDRAFAAGARN